MKVSLIDYTGAGSPNPARRAANLLLFTKSTRLQMSPALFSEIESKTSDEILAELAAMADTNPGSWEFIDFAFLIQDATRSFTHQLVRTRHASYAQQSLRVVDVSDNGGWTFETGASIVTVSERNSVYTGIMNVIGIGYKKLIELGAKIEDARGILPTNIHTNICVKIDMRNFINLIRKRQSLRVQNEYRNAAELMLIEVQRVYPWFYLFYKNDEAKAYKDLQDLIQDNDKLTPDEKTAMYKKLDIIRREL
jgi:thymidylate synthase (FAD)